MRNTVVATGHIGFRHQLDRARRFLERMEAVQSNEIDFQDLVWAFFQNCWHVKDWVKNDPEVPELTKQAVLSQAHASVVLGVCQQMCNGTKHLEDRPGAKHWYIEINEYADGRKEMDCILDNGEGSPVSGRSLARQCIAEWIRVLECHGLATARLS